MGGSCGVKSGRGRIMSVYRFGKGEGMSCEVVVVMMKCSILR